MPIDHDLKLYEKLIDEKASTNSPEILPNAGKFHAAIAMSKLLDKTKHSVKMVVGSFDGSISDQDNYYNALQSSLDRGVKFQILFLDHPNDKSKTYNLLLESKKNGKDISFKYASNDFVKQLSKDGEPKHFAVYDDSMFRFEKDTKNYLALFGFNDTPINSVLKKIFDTEFNRP